MVKNDEKLRWRWLKLSAAPFYLEKGLKSSVYDRVQITSRLSIHDLPFCLQWLPRGPSGWSEPTSPGCLAGWTAWSRGCRPGSLCTRKVRRWQSTVGQGNFEPVKGDGPCIYPLDKCHQTNQFSRKISKQVILVTFPLHAFHVQILWVICISWIFFSPCLLHSENYPKFASEDRGS